MKKIWFLTVLLVGSSLLVGCSEREAFLEQECNSWETCDIEESQITEASEENSPEVISWNGEENILVVEDKNMHTDNIINSAVDSRIRSLRSLPYWKNQLSFRDSNLPWISVRSHLFYWVSF